MARAGAAAAAAAEMFVARPRTVARVPTTGHASKSHLRQQHIKERQAFFAPKNKVPFSPFCASDTTRRARWSGKRQGCSEECSRSGNLAKQQIHSSSSSSIVSMAVPRQRDRSPAARCAPGQGPEVRGEGHADGRHGQAYHPARRIILLHPPLPSVGVSTGMERGCQQNGRLADGWPGRSRRPCSGRAGRNPARP